MKGLELYELLQEQFPDAAALNWDNVGLLCGSMDKEIKRVYIALDAGTAVIEDAINSSADLLLTHHPLIFSGIKRIVDSDFIGRRLLKLAENKIAYYAMHTNYDVKRMGDIVAGRMRLSNLVVLEPTTADQSEGIGYTGMLSEPMTLEAYAKTVKKEFNIPDVRIYGAPDTIINTVSVCPGSAKHMEDFALHQHADVLVGGDFGHHEGLDCVEKGICVIDAGHYGLEHVFVYDLKTFIQDHCPDIQIFTEKTIYPFKTV